MRAFLALALPDEARSEIGALVRPVATAHPAARWVRPENLHLTVEFLGGIDDATFEALDLRLEPVAAGVAPAELALSGAGAFPAGRPRVLWIGLVEGAAWFARLTEGVRAAVRAVGLEPDRRPPRAHVTLARQERPDRAALAALRDAFDERRFAWTSDRLTLFSSVLGRGGPTYTVERDWPFRGVG